MECPVHPVQRACCCRVRDRCFHRLSPHRAGQAHAGPMPGPCRPSGAPAVHLATSYHRPPDLPHCTGMILSSGKARAAPWYEYHKQRATPHEGKITRPSVNHSGPSPYVAVLVRCPASHCGPRLGERAGLVSCNGSNLGAVGINAFAVQLPPDLACTVDLEVLLPNTPDLRAQFGVALGAFTPLRRIGRPGRVGSISRWGRSAAHGRPARPHTGRDARR